MPHGQSVSRRLINGALAGLSATPPMTLAMRGLHALLPRPERYPLPPQLITTRMSKAAGVASQVVHPQEWELKTHVAHHAYGASCGAAYALLEPALPGPPAVKGALFGVGVWVVSYLGWLPAAGVLPPAHREPVRRNGVMLLAHVVWGATAGAMFARKSQR